MEIKTVENFGCDCTYSFPVKGSKMEEVKSKKKAGYVELARFRISNKLRTDAIACASCRHWTNQPFTSGNQASDHNGFCNEHKFPAEDYAACDSYAPKKGLFSHNPG